MKFLNTWLCSVSCLLISAVPALAQDPSADTESDAGAKGLFFQQMDSPSVAMNTGVQYWIELHRDGETIHANNKTKFRSGDSIRFHVKPNIDGFAYIMLRQGSRGEQSQLFPNAENHEDNNQITHGKEMVLPAGGALVFDHNPGLEKLTLLISRKPIDAKAFISGESEQTEKTAPAKFAPQRIAMACSGSKDLIPNQVLVSYVSPSGAYGSQLKDMPAAQHLASTSGETKTALAGTSTLRPSSMQATTVPTKVNKETSGKDVASRLQKSKTSVSASTAAKTDTKADVPTLFTAKKNTIKHVAKANVGKRKNTLAPGVVTVVYKNPDGVLAADISLEHL
ncbi:MAG: DUF4384 domain-containing protein [Candidatus Obscuribacterales bacterium]|nr:DUF4384 domain-containing protein [Candidatus Obscuribacterales bacterium]